MGVDGEADAQARLRRHRCSLLQRVVLRKSPLIALKGSRLLLGASDLHATYCTVMATLPDLERNGIQGPAKVKSGMYSTGCNFVITCRISVIFGSMELEKLSPFDRNRPRARATSA